MNSLLQEMGIAAKAAANSLRKASTKQKNEGLLAMEAALYTHQDAILTANAKDIAAAAANGLPTPMIERLTLNPQRIKGMADSFKEIAQLPDPVGYVEEMTKSADGLTIGKQRVPLGVIGIIYESRPNVTIDAAALCIKSGNATILRGGSEALHSNQALAKIVQAGLAHAGLPESAVQVVNTPDRAAVGELITMTEYVDVIVPRGGKSLIERLMADARVPMIKHLDGICHTYIDVAADIAKAIRVCDNAKTQRYAPCNTMETLLVHADIAQDVLPQLCRIYQDKAVELRVDAPTRALLEKNGLTNLIDAVEEDWSTEYLAPILSIKMVADLDAAIEHINHYGSAHTDAIITENHSTAQRFLREVDSSSVMINASTRFADGFEYGLGAEIGISNDKLHARGPVGLEGLTSLKYIVYGDGSVRV